MSFFGGDTIPPTPATQQEALALGATEFHMLNSEQATLWVSRLRPLSGVAYPAPVI